MWNISKNKDPSRGGFQNRDVGRSNFDDNFGPDFGPDYARFSDPPNLAADSKLREAVAERVARDFSGLAEKLEIQVRNGFVILKGEVPDEITRHKIITDVRTVPDVKEAINELWILS